MIVLRLLRFALMAFGLLAAIAVAAVAVPVKRPPELAAISDGVKGVDRSGMPGIKIFQARDGTGIGYRHYPAEGAALGTAILIHGSSGSSVGVHPLARVLAARGIESYAPDIRGHGASGTRGDIGYVGQLDDDLADMVAMIRASGNTMPLQLAGHSSGGGFALRIAGSAMQELFAHTYLLAPYLGTTAASTRSNSGGWASANVPRIVALSVLRGFGITCCDGLPVIAFAVPPNSARILTAEYSMRLLTNFAAARDYHRDLNAARGPITLIGAADDALMYSDRYAEAVSGTSARIDVRTIADAGHMDVVVKPRVMNEIAAIMLERMGR